MNDSQLEKDEKFHKFVTVMLCIWAYVGTIINCVKVGSVFSVFPQYLSICQIGIYLLNAVALILILYKRSIGVWIAFTMRALMVVVWSIYYNNLAGEVLIESILAILLLSLLLCIRKEKISGWKVLFGKDEK